MIKVFLKNFIQENGIQFKSSDELRIRVEGHSGYGQKGSDIVCSAVSATIQTTIVSITKIAKIHQNIVQRNGFLESSISIKDAKLDNLNALNIILNTMMVGLQCIMDNYPDALEIIFE